ncbi:hypothetical protein HMI54_014804 [Coelomomyces lativittatus]|nr:hypothetical protein HMI54_014804 [Coelomomyces lativittatus]
MLDFVIFFIFYFYGSFLRLVFFLYFVCNFMDTSMLDELHSSLTFSFSFFFFFFFFAHPLDFTSSAPGLFQLSSFFLSVLSPFLNLFRGRSLLLLRSLFSIFVTYFLLFFFRFFL